MHPRKSIFFPLLGPIMAAALTSSALADSVELSRPGIDRSQVRLSLEASLAPSWKDVNIGRLVVQTPGRQRRLDLAPLSKSRHLEADLAEARTECVLLIAELGPADTKGYSGSWQRITRVSKLMVCPPGRDPDALAARRRAGAALTAKSGSRIEVRPLFNPATVRVGRDLAVALYQGGEPQSDAKVIAQGPGGRLLRGRTDTAGVAVIRIPASGTWTVSYSVDRGDASHRASFSFDVLPETVWQSFLKGGA